MLELDMMNKRDLATAERTSRFEDEQTLSVEIRRLFTSQSPGYEQSSELRAETKYGLINERLEAWISGC